MSKKQAHAYEDDDADRKMRMVIEHYRSLAAEAQDAARASLPLRYREAYRKMAKHWNALANELEECMGWADSLVN